METLILQSIALLVAAFAISAVIGWALAGKKKVARAVVPAADWVETPVIEMPVAAKPVKPEPVAYLDAAAEHFTNGLVMPRAAAQGPAVAPSVTVIEPVAHAAPQPKVYNLVMPGDEPDLRRRISSLAGMTPESVEAAVQQAGSGLEPVRLSAPQGMIDDLTIISGIDYASQSDLNALGIYHFWQIAGWTPEHVAWVSNRVRLSKRIARENWMSQAAKLAKLS